jgi:hypothetical protein
MTSPAKFEFVAAYFQIHVFDHWYAEDRFVQTRVIDDRWHIMQDKTIDVQ